MLNYQFKIICNPPFILFKKKISYENNLQLKFFFLNNDFMPSFHEIFTKIHIT